MHPYQGKSAVISTKHGKGALVAPVFAKILEVSVTEIAVDTDLLGTRNIAHVAQLLAERISATCPICTTPGCGVVGYENGVHCELCKREVSEVAKSEKLGCAKFAHHATGKLLRETVGPGECQWCNP